MIDIKDAKIDFVSYFRKRPYYIACGKTKKNGKDAIYVVLDGNKITKLIEKNLPTSYYGFPIVYKFQYEEVKKQSKIKGARNAK